jgi:tetratricopeptide (TPR) repeat protein
MRRSLQSGSVLLAAVLAMSSPAVAQISHPPDGGNQRASVSQYISIVKVTIDYNSPKVHQPRTGEDRRGKIWGTLVPYGLTDLGFGTCKQCPWRAGANENTVLTVSQDVKIDGQSLPAGSYGLFMIADPDEWTVIFSKTHTSWGSFFYDPGEDALRVKVKPQKSDYHEWLTYEFPERNGDKATVAMKWEDLQVPLTISVDHIADLYIAQIRNELRNEKGFDWQNYNAAARYALDNKTDLAEGLKWAQAAVNATFVGQENFTTLMTLADLQAANGLDADAQKTREKGLNLPRATPIELHVYARALLAKGNKEEAFRIWELNAKLHPNEWPVNVGLARGHSAFGRYKEALKYANLAVKEAPDEQNRKALEAAVKKLEAGQDMN